jgi:Flp pilus assembly protein TadG
MNFVRNLTALARQNDGNVAVTFALSLAVLCLAGGLAIDYARAFGTQAMMQADLDAAVLGAAKKMADPAAVQAAAERMFNANWAKKHNVKNVQISVEQSNPRTLVGTAKARVPTTLMGIAGLTGVNVHARSEVEVAGNEIELSLVLDTTASMSGTKIAALKTSAKMLIDDVYDAPEADQHVKISIVPFGQYVNVGLANRNQSWMQVPADTQTPRQDCRNRQQVTGTSNCRMVNRNGEHDGVPYSYQEQVCDYTYGPPVYSCENYTEYNTWHGCVGSRNSPLDTQDSNWSSAAPGIMNAWCGTEVQALSNDKAALAAQIDSLTTSGDTYIPAGLFWGWTTLSKSAPFSQARDYGEIVDGKPVRKIMVLMTDGFNTLSPNYPEHNDNDRHEANDLTSELCTNIKAQNIELFTVAFEVSNNSMKHILRDCATTRGHFYDADSADQLSQAFQTIAASFTPLRIAK